MNPTVSSERFQSGQFKDGGSEIGGLPPAPFNQPLSHFKHHVVNPFEAFETVQNHHALYAANTKIFPSQRVPSRQTLQTRMPLGLDNQTDLLRGLKHGGMALGLFALGRLLHRLPNRSEMLLPTHLKGWKPLFDMVPIDWKDWARVGLGVGVVNQVNRSVDRKPPPWGRALETVAVLTPMMGKTMMDKTMWKHFPLMVVAIPALVQGTHWLQTMAEKKRTEDHLPIPKWVADVGIPVLSTVVGVLGLRGLLKSTGQVVGSEVAAVCTRCGGIHMLCPTEIGEFFGGLFSGLGGNKTDLSTTNGAPHR